MKNKNQIALANPFDLAHVLEFKLRLVAAETWQKIQDERKPKRKNEDLSSSYRRGNEVEDISDREKLEKGQEEDDLSGEPLQVN